MKKAQLLITILYSFFYFSQIKVNERKDIEIFLTDTNISMEKYLNPKTPYLYKIINHSNYNYIIDPNGFIGEAQLYEYNELYTKPKKLLPQGYYLRDLEDCKHSFIIVEAKSIIFVELSLLNIKYDYNIEPNVYYYLNIKSKHNEYSATLLGCESYIKNLTKKGYKVFDDNIYIKIPLTK